MRMCENLGVRISTRALFWWRNSRHAHCTLSLTYTYKVKNTLAFKRMRTNSEYGSPYLVVCHSLWICICRSFPFNLYIYVRRVFKWITQQNFVRFALVNSLVFAALFNGKKACVGHYGNEKLHLFFNLLLVSKSPTELSLSSALLWNCALMLICPV